MSSLVDLFDRLGLPRSTLRALSLLLAVASVAAMIATALVLGAALFGAALGCALFERRLAARLGDRALAPEREGSVVGRGSLLRNATAGAIATAADFALVALLVEQGLLSPAIATAVGCGLGAAVNFTINRVWAFGSRAPKLGQAARYVFVSASSAALNSGLVAVVLLLPAMPYQLAWVLVRGAVYLSWNFPLHRDWVFADGAS